DGAALAVDGCGWLAGRGAIGAAKRDGASAFRNAVAYFKQAIQVVVNVVELASEEESQVVAFVELTDKGYPRRRQLQFGGPNVLRIAHLSSAREQLFQIAGTRTAIAGVENGGGGGESQVRDSAAGKDREGRDGAGNVGAGEAGGGNLGGVGNDFIHPRMVSAHNKLSRRHTLPVLVERELEHDSCLHPWLIGFRAGPVAEPSSLIRSECGRASDRQDNGELRLDFEIARVELNAGTELGSALVQSAHAHAQARRFEETGQGRGNEAPVLAEFRKPRQSTAEFCVKSHVREAKAKLAGTNPADVAVVDVGVVAFVVGFHFAGDRHIGIFRDPLELAAHTEAAGLKVEWRVRGGTGVAAKQQRQRPLLAAKCGAAAGGGIFD